MAPSIIGQMIALPLAMGSTEGKPLWNVESQESLQFNLLIISVICVPWMLIFKPTILWFQMPSKSGRRSSHHLSEDDMIEDLKQGLNEEVVSSNKLVKPLIERTLDIKEMKKSHDEH